MLAMKIHRHCNNMQEKLENEQIVTLSPDKKASMVSNLLVVLCGDEPAQPVVNSGGNSF